MHPVRLALPGRSLLLVAGMPGAGKSTLLARLPARPDVAVLDSDAQRAALQPVFGAVPYRSYRPLVHAWHRLAVLVAAFSAVPTVVVHLPATGARTRSAVALLARMSGRAAYLLWLHVDPADARAGQRARGRVVGDASFNGHAGRALATTDALRDGPPPGFAQVTVLDRRAAARGVCLTTDELVASAASPPQISTAQPPAGGVAGPAEYARYEARTGALPANAWIRRYPQRTSGAGH